MGWEEDNGRTNSDHMSHQRPLVATATMAGSAATSWENCDSAAVGAELPSISVDHMSALAPPPSSVVFSDS